MDWSTGRILDVLKELNIDHRTLVIFTSDNGAGVRNAKAKPNDRFPGRNLVGSNGELRGGKGSTYEGGIRVPCIAWWPQTIGAGRVENTAWSAIDLFPTFAKLAQTNVAEKVILDGAEMSQLVLGKGDVDDSRLFFHYFGVQLQAVRKGPWKLFVPIDHLPERRVPSLWFTHQPGLFERQHRLWPEPTLYNLREEINEKNNVAAKHPEVVTELLNQAKAFDLQFQAQMPPVQYLPSP